MTLKKCTSCGAVVTTKNALVTSLWGGKRSARGEFGHMKYLMVNCPCTSSLTIFTKADQLKIAKRKAA